MKKYTLLAFDIDGTLVDTEGTSISSLQKTVKDLMGMEISYEKALETFGIPSYLVPEIYGYHTPEEFSRTWASNFIALNYLMKPFPGVLDVLSELRKRGYIIGAVTSRNLFEMEKDPNAPVLKPFFDIIITAEDTVKHKPDPDPTLELIRRASAMIGRQIEPGECLYLGDTAHDFGCGHDAGADFALADWKKRGAGDIPADYVFTDAEELLNIFEE